MIVLLWLHLRFYYWFARRVSAALPAARVLRTLSPLCVYVVRNARFSVMRDAHGLLMPAAPPNAPARLTLTLTADGFRRLFTRACLPGLTT